MTKLKSIDDLVDDADLLRTPLTPAELLEPLQPGERNGAPRYKSLRKAVQLKKQPTLVKDEKQKLALQMRIQGVKTKAVAEVFGVSEVTIRQWTREGIAKGMADSIRNQIAEKLLPKAARAYEDILSSSASDLSEHHKGHEVKLKAARDVAKGLGVLRPESQVTTRSTKLSMGLDDYMEMRSARKAHKLVDEEEAVIDGEAREVEAESEAPHLAHE